MIDVTAPDPFLELLDAKDPAPLIHALRAEDPVHFVDPLGFWFATRHDDVKSLFNDPENVTQDRRAWEHFVPQPEGSLVRWMQDRSLAAQGPEAHARFRRLFSAALTPRAVRRMDLIRGFFPFAASDAMAQTEAALQEMAAWVREMAGERRSAPHEDLISDLIRTQERDARLTDEDIVMLISVLLGAGSETTNLGGLVLIQTLLHLLVFGNGPHYCLGANLARQEMGCMLDAALDIVTPGSRFREDLQEFQPMGLFRRPLNLPVEIAG